MSINIAICWSFIFQLTLLVGQAELTNLTSWLGSQSPKKNTLRLKTQELRDKFLEDYEVSATVMKAERLSLPKSENSTFTIDKGKIKYIESDDIPASGFVIHGLFKIKEGKLGKNFYILQVRVKSGPLKGAVLNMLDEHPRLVTNPSSSVFIIPHDIKLDEGPLEVEPIEIFAK